MKSNHSAPVNLPAQVIAQIAQAIAQAIACGQDPRVAEQAILTKLAQTPSR